VYKSRASITEAHLCPSAPNQIAKADIIVGDPSYFPESKTRRTGRVVRSIVIMDHPVANTGDSESTQIIIPATEVGTPVPSLAPRDGRRLYAAPSHSLLGITSGCRP
jgi:hypothetical protein